jgi:hypothetical protein
MKSICSEQCAKEGSPRQAQFEWLKATLKTAQVTGMAVHLLGHQPPLDVASPTAGQWLPGYWSKFTALLTEYPVVKGMFFGHIHTDQWVVARYVTSAHSTAAHCISSTLSICKSDLICKPAHAIPPKLVTGGSNVARFAHVCASICILSFHPHISALLGQYSVDSSCQILNFRPFPFFRSFRCVNVASVRCVNFASVRCVITGSFRCVNVASVRCVNVASVRCVITGSF